MLCQTITSTKNPIIVKARSLSNSIQRRETRTFLLDGEHMVSEALAMCPQLVQTLFVVEGCIGRYDELLQSVNAETRIFPVSNQAMAALSQVKTPQGIAAVCGMPTLTALDRFSGRIVLLENVQDPGNVGTVLRTADAAGFQGVILTHGCADPYSPKALRATMGSIFRVPICMNVEADEALKTLHSCGFITVGASLSGLPYYERGAMQSDLCLLIGNEGAGLLPQTQAQCTHLYRLPMRGGAESLNAAIAAAVLMYDLMNRE